MYKIAVMGDRDSIYGFAALGLDTYPVTDPIEAARKLRGLAEQEYAVVYITEALAETLEAEIDRYREQMLPAIILIPGASGNTGKGVAAVKKSVDVYKRQTLHILNIDAELRKLTGQKADRIRDIAVNDTNTGESRITRHGNIWKVYSCLLYTSRCV